MGIVEMWRELTWRRLLAVAGVSFLLATQIFFQQHIFEYEVEDTLHAFAEYFAEIAVVGLVILLAVTFVDHAWPQEGARRTLALTIAVIGGSVTGVGLGLAWRYGLGEPQAPLYSLGEAIRWASLAGIFTLVHELQRRERRVASALHDLEVNRVVLERRRVEARLRIMQAQIEPHFLFNTLATVKRLFRTEPESGAAMLASLMQYLRGALPRLRDDESSLGDELELACAYLEILQIRMGERLQFSTRVPEHLRCLPLPPMMLITLVENAVKHGISRTSDGGRIEIEARESAGRLLIDVRDTGAGLCGSGGTGIGLSNIRARLHALHGPRAALTLEPNAPTGVVASLRLPLAAGAPA